MITSKVWMRMVCGMALASGALMFERRSLAAQLQETPPARAASQAVDDAYTAKIKQYTTEPYFSRRW